jgi:hypothetical protein
MQDVVAIVIGVFAALSPLWLDTNNAAMWSLIVLGVLVALSGLVHMSRPEMTVAEYAMAVFGVLLFLSPWVMNFDAFTGASWTAWVVGVLAVVVAVTGLPMMSSRMHAHGGLATNQLSVNHSTLNIFGGGALVTGVSPAVHVRKGPCQHPISVSPVAPNRGKAGGGAARRSTATPGN